MSELINKNNSEETIVKIEITRANDKKEITCSKHSNHNKTKKNIYEH